MIKILESKKVKLKIPIKKLKDRHLNQDYNDDKKETIK